MRTKNDVNEDLALLRVTIEAEVPRAALSAMSDAVPDAIEALEAAWPT